MATIGFIGLGLMGVPMSAHLVRSGHRVQGFDSSAGACRQAAANSVEISASARETTAGCDALMTMLPQGDAVRSVLISGDKLLEHVPPGTVIIDSSSIDVATARDVHARAQVLELPCVDAPVSGGVTGAIAGTLTFMIGGTEAAVGLATPYLTSMGRKIAHVGGPSAGQATKACNQLLFGSTLAAVAEMFLLGEQLDLDPKVLFDIVTSSSGDCWAIRNFCPWPGIVDGSAADNGYAAKFSAALMAKDIRIAMGAARAAQQHLPVGSRTSELFNDLAESDPGLDASAIIREIRRLPAEPSRPK